MKDCLLKVNFNLFITMFSENQIDAFRSLKTPFYFYDTDLLKKTLDIIKKLTLETGYEIHYAIKANANPRLLHLISSYGLGADCVSGNEIKAAMACGFDPGKIVYAGVGKTEDEIHYALSCNIFALNCESIPEMEIVQSIAKKMNQNVKIAIRLNPNLNANTHHYITTGLEENKFGINLWDLTKTLNLLNSMPNISVIGLHFHLGSQIMDMGVFRNLCTKINKIQNDLKRHNIVFPHLNLGGGLGVDYLDPDQFAISDFNEYFAIFKKFLDPNKGQTIHFEPGRAIIAQCGSLISRVTYIKEGVNTDFAILDAGMTELLRPALYQAYHKIENLTSKEPDKKIKYDVVGPICETSDSFAKNYLLPETKRGDLIAIRSTGAYGEVMSSSYNLRDKAPSYFSDQL